MKIVRVNKLPSGVKAIFLFGVVVTRKHTRIDQRTLTHEGIHSRQFKEVTLCLIPIVVILSMLFSYWLLFLLPFTYYIWYIVEWALRAVVYEIQDLIGVKKNYVKKAYKNILFEREAFKNENNLLYLNNRKYFNWAKIK